MSVPMIYLLSIALAYDHQPDLTIPDGDIRVAIIGDVHVGADLTGLPVASRPPRETLRLALEAALVAGADLVFLNGDLGGADCYAGRDPVTDLPIRQCLGGTIPGRLPRPEEAAEVWRQIVASGYPPEQIYYESGNHDGASGWMIPYLDTLLNRGVKAAAPGTTHDSFYVRTRLTCSPSPDVVVDWLGLGDRNRTQDYGACGQLVAKDYELTSFGAPAASYDLDQLDFLRARLLRTAELGYSLAIVAHVPPPETTFGTWAGEGMETLACTGASAGSLHGPTPAVSLDARPSASWVSPYDGLTSAERCDEWNGTAAFLGESDVPRPDWPRVMLGQVEAESGLPHSLRLWVGSHSHVPSPVFEQNGHGLDALLYPDGGGAPVRVVQTGGATRYHGAKGMSSFVVVEWGCDGMYTVERWAIDWPWAPATCGTAWRPYGQTLPGPFPITPLQGSW